MSSICVQFLSTLVGVIYFRQDYDQSGAVSIAGAIFWVTMNLTFSNYTSTLSVRETDSFVYEFHLFRQKRVTFF